MSTASPNSSPAPPARRSSFLQASDGYYELDSYEDLVWFQQYVDAGNLEINARLTADIVANLEATRARTHVAFAAQPLAGIGRA